MDQKGILLSKVWCSNDPYIIYRYGFGPVATRKLGQMVRTCHIHVPLFRSPLGGAGDFLPLQGDFEIKGHGCGRSGPPVLIFL